MNRLPLALILAALLTGCAGHPVTETRVEHLDLPAALLTCSDAPAAPGPDVTQRDVALYVLDLWAAGDDCRGKLGRVRELVADPS